MTLTIDDFRQWGKEGGRKGGRAKVAKGFASPAVQNKAQESLRKRRKLSKQGDAAKICGSPEKGSQLVSG